MISDWNDTDEQRSLFSVSGLKDEKWIKK